MTVADLIRRLEALPQDATVVIERAYDFHAIAVDSLTAALVAVRADTEPTLFPEVDPQTVREALAS